MTAIEQLFRRLKYGEPIVVVSGLPRSGTSMAMKMLQAGGVPLLTDSVRPADESNPRGYFEFERVKALEQHADVSWLPEARGKAVKIISFLLTWLPEVYDYRVVFMVRDIDEVITSQSRMLAVRGEPAQPPSTTPRATPAVYAQHLQQVDRFISSRRCFRTLQIPYRSVVEHPTTEARRVAEFLGRRLELDRMAAAIDPSLYHNRR